MTMQRTLQSHQKPHRVTRTLSPDDEMLRILEAMGTLALLTRHTPKEFAEERESFQELFDLNQHHSVEA